MDLTVVLADFFPEAAALAAASEQLPELPALATLLRYGERVRVGSDWRAWVAQSLGRTDLARLPYAQVAAAGLAESDGAVCLATPVHLLAGIDHVRLHPAGLLRLDAAQSQQLADNFHAVFGESGWRLAPLSGDLILQGLATQERGDFDRTARDPGRWLGANIQPAIAQGGSAPLLRRATAEIEMWLHEQPLNHTRARRGELAVNSLWLWGNEPLRDADASVTHAGTVSSAPAILAHDAFVTGLCAASAMPLPDPPVRFADITRSSLVVLSAAARDPRDTPLLRIEAEWLQPALAALQAGSVSRLRMHASGTLVTLTSAGLRRFWRRRRPWWQGLFAG